MINRSLFTGGSPFAKAKFIMLVSFTCIGAGGALLLLDSDLKEVPFIFKVLLITHRNKKVKSKNLIKK